MMVVVARERQDALAARLFSLSFFAFESLPKISLSKNYRLMVENDVFVCPRYEMMMVVARERQDALAASHARAGALERRAAALTKQLREAGITVRNLSLQRI